LAIETKWLTIYDLLITKYASKGENVFRALFFAGLKYNVLHTLFCIKYCVIFAMFSLAVCSTNKSKTTLTNRLEFSYRFGRTRSLATSLKAQVTELLDTGVLSSPPTAG
jgi:hypothetical protein